MNTKVTVQEVVDAINDLSVAVLELSTPDDEFNLDYRAMRTRYKALTERIQTHGIEVAYTPMTEIDRYRIKDSFQYATSGDLGKIAIVEQAVLARLGVAPTVKESLTVALKTNDGTELLDAITTAYRRGFAEAKAESTDSVVKDSLITELDQAKHQLCGCVLCTCEDDERCHGCGAKYCQDHKIKRDGSYLTNLDQAKRVCEEAGLAVVPKNPAAGGWNEAARGVE